MAGNKSPKTIATINFKGGVGKTTVTWCLADTLATYSNASVLMFDLDAQMSLTQAVGLNEDSGSLHAAFGSWYDRSVSDRRTIFDAIDQYTKPGAHFDFPIAYDFIYQIAKGLHFVPSVEDLYWLELEVFDRDQMKDFILLGLPVPGIFVYLKDKKQLIVDGQQRLITLDRFLSGTWETKTRKQGGKDVEVVTPFDLVDVDPAWEGRTFQKLDKDDRDEIENYLRH